ncbi:MAG: HAD-IA family hydrolase [Treponema sp.]|jgi:HAD superfamily hydrolase (TIGR01509 family)|nr:HAD-IA family hydrolase [Treponema sp.]
MKAEALLFDCDGVLAETERDGHRVAYNRAMKELGLDIEWTVEEYAELVLISGGKERLRFFFDKNPRRFPPEEFDAGLIQRIYSEKTEIFKGMVNKGAIPPRSGIARLIREAHAEGIMLFVCSTSHRESVEALIRYNYGTECLSWFTELFCGDIVACKKPAPDVYILPADKYHLNKGACFVIEDSRNGLLAARNAGMHCLVTQSYYTTREDFSGADIVTTCLGDPDGEQCRIVQSRRPLPERGYITVSDLLELL